MGEEGKRNREMGSGSVVLYTEESNWGEWELGR